MKRLFVALLIFASASWAQAANITIGELVADTTPGSTDVIEIEQSDASASNKSTLANVITKAHGLGNWKFGYTDGSGVLTGVTVGAAGTFPLFQGTTSAPIVSTLILPNSATAYKLLAASATNTVSELAAVGAAGEILIGKAGALPVWLGAGAAGKILMGAGAADPTWTAWTLPSTVPTVGKVFISDGTNMVGSTALGTGAYATIANYAPLASPTFTGSVILPSANADPAATAGSLVHDSTITGLTGGALKYFNGTNNRIVVDLDTAPSDDDYVVAYDADADKFYMRSVAGAAHDAVTLQTELATILTLSSQELQLDQQGSNLVLAGPATTGTGYPAFRALVAADLPAGVASIAGLTESQGALIYSSADNTYAVLAKGTAGQLLQMNTGATAPEWTSTITGTFDIGTSVGSGHAVTMDADGKLQTAFANLLPDAADGAAIGSATAEWSDLYLADGGVIYFQNDQSVYLTPSAATLTLTGSFVATGAISANNVNPDTADGATLGTTALEWSDLYLADGGVIYFQNDQSVYLTPSAGTLTLTGKFAATGGTSVLTPVIDDADNFDDNFTGANLYGGTFIVNAAGTIVLPDPAVGMNFTIVLEAAAATIIDPLGTGTADTIVMNGLAATADENITSSTVGAMCVFQYRAANSWMATCDGFAEAN